MQNEFVKTESRELLTVSKNEEHFCHFKQNIRKQINYFPVVLFVKRAFFTHSLPILGEIFSISFRLSPSEIPKTFYSVSHLFLFPSSTCRAFVYNDAMAGKGKVET